MRDEILISPVEMTGCIPAKKTIRFYAWIPKDHIHWRIMPEDHDTSVGLFKKFLANNKIFKNREVLRHSYRPQYPPPQAPAD